MGAPSAPPMRRKRRKMSGIAWIFVALLVFFVGAAAFTAMVAPLRKGNVGIIAPAPSKSYVGVNGFDTVDDDAGVTFQSVDAPDGPADKAGLIGGDIITSFDGQPVGKQNDIMDLLRRVPIGKTVEVVYSRDGVSRKTQLTTVSRDEYNRIGDAYEKRPEGNGVFGFQRGRTTRVNILLQQSV